MSRRLLVPAVACLLAWPLAPAAGQAPPPVFGETLEVRVVNLEVVVTDRDGLPVTGLASEDFRLTVGGREVPIRYFSEVRGGDVIDLAPGVSTAVAGVPDLVPGTPVGTSYLVFVDDFFSIAKDRNRVLRSLGDQLGRLGPEDRLAMVAFDGVRLEMLTSWTQSSPVIQRAIQKATERPALGLQRLSERRSMAADQRLRRDLGVSRGALDSRLDITERYFAERIEQQVASAVAGVAAALRGFANPPGRKVLLLLSGGWPYDPADYAANELGRLVTEPGLQRGDRLLAPMVDTANQLGYTVYAVDVPGVDSESLGSADSAEVPALDAASAAFQRESNVQWTLQYVAQETGGRALLNARRLQALERAAADTRSYYWIGFVPDWQGNDARHRVDVQVLRQGLEVRSRAGYVDMSRQTEVGMAVESVLLFGDGPGVRPLAVRVGRPERLSGSTMRVPIELGIPLDHLTFVPVAGGLATELELRVAALDERGQRSEVPLIPVRLQVAEPPPPGRFARYETALELRRLRNQVVVAVYDPVRGTIYSATVDIRP